MERDPFTIQRLPVGLLDMLAMKGSGETPHLLSDRIQGTVNLNELYFAQIQIQVATGATSNVNATDRWLLPTSPIPSNEIWVVRSFTCAWTTGAGTTGTYNPMIVRRGFAGLSAQSLVQGAPVTVAASSNGIAFARFPPWELFYPGDNFGAWFQVGTYGVASPVNVSIEYTRLQN
jgi:hypothetical protein